MLAFALVGVSLVAAAEVVISNVPPAAPVTFDQVRVFVYTTLAMVLLAVITLSAGVVAFVLNRDRAHAVVAETAAAAAVAADRATQKEQFAVIGRAVESVGDAVHGLAEALRLHDELPFAHSAAFHAQHDPMLKELAEVTRHLTELRSEHNVIHRNEDTICSLLKKRDPAMSPHPRRATDAPEYNAATAHPDGGSVRGRGHE